MAEDTPITYGFRIIHQSTGEQVGGDEYSSPFEVGQAMVECWKQLTFTRGYKADQLGLQGIAVEAGEVRSWTPSEEAASVTALRQFIASKEGRP